MSKLRKPRRAPGTSCPILGTFEITKDESYLCIVDKPSGGHTSDWVKQKRDLKDVSCVGMITGASLYVAHMSAILTSKKNFVCSPDFIVGESFTAHGTTEPRYWCGSIKCKHDERASAYCLGKDFKRGVDIVLKVADNFVCQYCLGTAVESEEDKKFRRVREPPKPSTSTVVYESENELQDSSDEDEQGWKTPLAMKRTRRQKILKVVSKWFDSNKSKEKSRSKQLVEYSSSSEEFSDESDRSYDKAKGHGNDLIDQSAHECSNDEDSSSAGEDSQDEKAFSDSSVVQQYLTDGEDQETPTASMVIETAEIEAIVEVVAAIEARDIGGDGKMVNDGGTQADKEGTQGKKRQTDSQSGGFKKQRSQPKDFNLRPSTKRIATKKD